MTLLERLEAHAFNLENTLAHDVDAALLREAHAALTAKEAAIEAQAGELARLRKRIRDAAIKGNTYLLHEKHREGLEVLTLEVSQVFDELTAALKGVNHEP